MNNQQNNKHRLAAWAALLLGIAATAVPEAAAERFVPGVTDFPARPAYVQQDDFSPGVTDFPARPAYVDPALAPPRILQVVRIPAADRFDWADAGVGAGAAAAAALAAAAIGVTRMRRFRHG
jgi:hypothetical protein